MRTRLPFWKAVPHWARRSARMPQVSQIQRTTSAGTLSCRLKRMTQRQSCSAGITRIFKCQGRGSKLSKSGRCQGCDPTEQKLGALREELKLFGRDPNEAGKRSASQMAYRSLSDDLMRSGSAPSTRMYYMSLIL